MKHTVKMTFDHSSWRQLLVASTIRRCIQATLDAEGIDIPCEINVLVTNDQGIHEINKATREVDRPTDVLSFPEFEFTPGEPPTEEDDEALLDPATGRLPLGDMVISMERVEAQAEEFGHSKRRELAYLVVHSVLHLLGYDHLDEGEQKKQMRGREEAIASSIPGMERK